MDFLALTLSSLNENLALDEALLLELESGQGREVLRVWEWSAFAVVLGAGCWLSQDVDEAACLADGVEIVRRSSGGGTVLLGPGCLLFTVVLSYEREERLREIGSSYQYILGRVAEALTGILPDPTLAGTSDLAAAGRKFSGNAQQRKARGILHHGTLLYEFDLARIGRYLHQPGRQPDYRGRREHEDFLTNLPCDAPELKRSLRRAWAADIETTAWPCESIRTLVREKYSRAEWLRRRS
jgi:lipoate-protein ligase A